MKMSLLACLFTIIIGSYTWAAAPTITGFTPINGPVGTVVTISGTNLTGASEVNFNVSSAKIIPVNATSLKVIVPIDATSGKITVTTPDGTAVSVVDFIVSASTNAVDGAELVWVPGGTFIMGSPEDVGLNDEHPEHLVTLTGFWLYKYEVTVAQYRAFCTATKRKLPEFPAGYSWAGKIGWDDPALQQHPIVNVSWNDAQAYATWAKATLPTEAQWEYAARGTGGRNYPWGGAATADQKFDGLDATKCANTTNSFSKDISTWPVGSFPAGASWCGAQDLAGNAFEWCFDWYGDYPEIQATNPTGPENGELRVLRGASWFNSHNYNRGAFRDNYMPDEWNSYIGFRCVSLAPGV